MNLFGISHEIITIIHRILILRSVILGKRFQGVQVEKKNII